ncbi:adenosine deaminase family protein [Georgenia sp. SUBG003]|uniref:adenosine deaminase family protein n=1 Tax=Georgenia sp. SUBG003 TaxID=1497974 RepID=UPI003AB15BD4
MSASTRARSVRSRASASRRSASAARASADFAPAFRIARHAGLAGVPHGGELLGPEHVRDVVAHLKPARLGHGVRSAEDPELLARLVDAGVALEVCPSSNVSLGVYHDAGDVPLRTLLDAGARVALGADDPLLFLSRLNDQYRVAREDHGLDDAALASLARSSIDVSLASETSKRAMLADVDAWLAAPVMVG